VTIKGFKDYFVSELNGLYPKEEVESFFNLLCESYLGLSRVESITNKNQILSNKIEKQFQEATQKLKSFEPIQYIIGSTEFYGLTFKVNQDTLIPRPETEELVDWVIKSHASNQKSILDIGTGSGCIAISLTKTIPNVSVSALDISNDAIKIANQNATFHKVAVDFEVADILKINSLSQKYDIIISNPPYVRHSEKEMMQKNVLDFEPSRALFVTDEDPLIFYKKISALAKRFLNPDGFLFFEINEYLSKEVIQLLENEKFKGIELKQDFFGKDRMVKCSLSE